MTSQNLSIVLVLCIISLCVCSILNNNQLEAFGQCGSSKCGACGACGTSQTAPVGTPRCDLKGQLLRTRPIDECKCHKFRDCYNSNPYQFPIKHIN